MKMKKRLFRIMPYFIKARMFKKELSKFAEIPLPSPLPPRPFSHDIFITKNFVIQQYVSDLTVYLSQNINGTLERRPVFLIRFLSKPKYVTGSWMLTLYDFLYDANHDVQIEWDRFKEIYG